MPDCFGNSGLEDKLANSQERVNDRFLSVNNQVSDISRTLALLTEKVDKAQEQLEHLQTLENAALTRNKHKASEVFKKLGKQMGIIKPDVYIFEIWLNYVRSTRTERLIRKAVASEREVMENRIFVLQQQLDSKTTEIETQAKVIYDLNAILDELIARPTNETVVDRMSTLDARFKRTEDNNAKFLAMIDSLAKNVSSTIDRLATSHTDHIEWVIGNFAQQLKSRVFRFISADFSLGGIPGFQLTLEISGASDSAAPLPGSLSLRVSCWTPAHAELEFSISDKKTKFTHDFDSTNKEISFNDISSVSRAYDSRGDCVSVSISLISLVSKIPVAGGQGQTFADLNVVASSANSVQAIRSIVSREISAFQESLASVAEWRVDNARAVCGRHVEIFSSPFRLQGLSRVVVSLLVDKFDETATVRVAVTQPGLKSLKLAVNVGSHSRILEATNVTTDRTTLEKRKFCKVYPEIENITDSILVVIRIIDLQLHTGNGASSSSAIQVKTYRPSGAEDNENNSGVISRPVFVPPLNESPVYDQALVQTHKEDDRIRDLQTHKLTC